MRPTLVKHLLVAIVAVLAAGCASETGGEQVDSTATASTDAVTGPTTFAYADLPGVDPNLTSVDVYLPAGRYRW